MLRALKPDDVETALSSTSQLSLAIAHQQKIQQQLEQKIEIYRQVLHAAPVGYLHVDDENQLIWSNPQAQQLLCIAREVDAKPRLLLELVRSYELDQLIEDTREAGQPHRREWTFYPIIPDPAQLSQQQAYVLRGYAIPLPQSGVGIFLENRQEAIMLMQQRDRWASDVAHELKTPLTSIRLVAETLQARLNPPLRNWVDRLINETMRLSHLVQDLLDMSQLDRTSFYALELKTVDLAELVQAAWTGLEPLARRKHLQLDYIGPDQLLMELDEARMYRVLINLLDNSIKYSPPRQHIRVEVSVGKNIRISSADPDQDQVSLDVIDAGPGFPDGDLPHVFERFYRADPSRSRTLDPDRSTQATTSVATVPFVTEPTLDYSHDQAVTQQRNSSGLGLAIVRQIVEAHHGTVTASNHPDTGGAWLQVHLPHSTTPTSS